MTTDPRDNAPATHVELIDERDAVVIIESPKFRVQIVDGTSWATYSMNGSLPGVTQWAATKADGLPYAIYVEVPLETETGSVALARVGGDFHED
ncbi:MAG: hypothetical protein NTV23_17030 [Propionibacteriales bacterium]|nr:hypothetical protein [Propionibacteriales bacterium]